MSHKLPRTLQAVPNTLHARLEIADAMRKLSAADQEGWVQQRRAALAALRRDMEKLREDLRKIRSAFPTLLLTELCKAGFNPDEPRVPAGDSKGGQWTKEGGSGSWIDSVTDWVRHTSDPEWAEAQNVQDLVENHPRAAIISGSAGLGIALGPAIIALAADALVVEGFSVAGRVAELQEAIPAAQQGRITMAVGLAEDASGSRFVLIGSSERMGYLRRSVLPLNPGEIRIQGIGHAEADIVNFVRQNGLNLLEIGATRPICRSCASLIDEVGATPVTRLKVP
jgi:hypothetical protein